MVSRCSSICTSRRVRWPLHPQPRSYDTLERYVRRLAECYGARYEHFCLRALGIPLADSRARWFAEPASEVLQRLSAGTGIPIGQLEQMTLARVWDRLTEELRRITATAEGRIAFEQSIGLPVA